MNMRQFVPFIIVKVQTDDDAVEHADSWQV
jgi:hypothetical protein